VNSRKLQFPLLRDAAEDDHWFLEPFSIGTFFYVSYHTHLQV